MSKEYTKVRNVYTPASRSGNTLLLDAGVFLMGVVVFVLALIVGGSFVGWGW